MNFTSNLFVELFSIQGTKFRNHPARKHFPNSRTAVLRNLLQKARRSLSIERRENRNTNEVWTMALALRSIFVGSMRFGFVISK